MGKTGHITSQKQTKINR